ncbi:Transcriptional regulator, TetR family [[Actinomadura] parvosata subsp. kistnae]|uniref:TetR family transcriptional regulator n=1 Tax=[Actinomadura] parvosata subsp. kistnae TaxID=1909395 RepID=A0A1V0A1L6_9ACTN|nr:TetR family transcriptional regulator [Nonomuraea sp. ATCC 55076]AQZ64116.1 TetR family transcriptional regulator [Nonomuraea sp. ATCC 55076]SPL87404.1 Transcriptional regulator, TetR family [Actinomadura parvosata subsp. kistnae]
MSGRDPDRRRALLDAADRVIMKEGPGVSMAAIAAEAGITKPILYRHFGDKHGLYQALADRHVRTVIAQLRPEFAATGADPRGRARAAIGVYFDLIAANRNLYRFLFHRAGAEDSRVRSHMTSLVRSLGEELGEVLAAERAVPDPTRAQVLGHAFVGMVQTTGDWWLDHPEVDRDEVVEGLVDVIALALTPAPRTGSPARTA